jgi:hypothetical protein
MGSLQAAQGQTTFAQRLSAFVGSCRRRPAHYRIGHTVKSASEEPAYRRHGERGIASAASKIVLPEGANGKSVVA